MYCRWNRWTLPLSVSLLNKRAHTYIKFCLLSIHDKLGFLRYIKAILLTIHVMLPSDDSQKSEHTSFLNSTARHPSSFSSMISETLTVPGNSGEPDYQRGISRGIPNSKVTASQLDKPLSDNTFRVADYETFLRQFLSNTDAIYVLKNAAPQAVFNQVLQSLIVDYTIDSNVSNKSAYRQSVKHNSPFPVFQPQKSIPQMMFSRAPDGQVGLLSSLCCFAISAMETDPRFYGMPYNADNGRFELKELSETEYHDHLSTFFTSFQEWLNSDENRAYLSFADVLTYCREMALENPKNPSFLPVSSVIVNALAKSPTHFKVLDVTTLYPDQDAIPGYDPLIASDDNDIEAKNHAREHALFLLNGFELPNGFKDQKIRGHSHSAVSTKPMTHDAYAELEQKMVQDAKLAHTQNTGLVRLFLEGLVGTTNRLKLSR